jgi:hypothetical protein
MRLAWMAGIGGILETREGSPRRGEAAWGMGGIAVFIIIGSNLLLMFTLYDTEPRALLEEIGGFVPNGFGNTSVFIPH